MAVIIKVENLSKAYQLGEIGTGTLSRDLERWFAKIRGKEDPFLRIGETNDRTSKSSSNIVWSLKDISFEVEQGDAVGIIGRNGAGKSTLLKILSRVTSPTTGRISGKGRIASLLEVGTGFHPELTGRENIFLNGAILGMRKREIQKKFDEIVDFAGVERYVDTPVKRYSSGMYVRLAFAVAAHLESEILVVDEVLAVGDAEFQMKCLGKMSDVRRGEGRTVLFVSHNMSSIRSLCNRGLFLSNGLSMQTRDVEEAISLYSNSYNDVINSFNPIGRKGSQIIRIDNIEVKGEGSIVCSGSKCVVNFEFSSSPNSSDRIRLDFRINSVRGHSVGWISTSLAQEDVIITDRRLSFAIPALPLNRGIYVITFCLYLNQEIADWCQNAYSFEVEAGKFYPSGQLPPVEQSDNLINFELC